MADILITGGTVITMDPQRRVIEDGAVAIEADRIVAVGSRQEVEDAHSADRVIHAQRKVIMPGLIDAHGHAGHALVKTMGHGPGAMWSNTADYIYAEGTDEEFWHAEALLASLDRLKNGTTCGVTYFGGGTMVMRVDELGLRRPPLRGRWADGHPRVPCRRPQQPSISQAVRTLGQRQQADLYGRLRPVHANHRGDHSALAWRGRWPHPRLGDVGYAEPGAFSLQARRRWKTSRLRPAPSRTSPRSTA